MEQKKKNYITIKDIARKLGISTSTVSRALRDQPDVNPETKEQVRKLAEELNYQPNLFASGLVSRRTRLLGVVVPRISNHFFSAITSGVQNVAYKHQYRVIICESDHSVERERENIEALLSIRVDGIIVAPLMDYEHSMTDHLANILARDVPLVYVDRVQPAVVASSILIDDFLAAREATEYLISTGCRRLAHFTGPQWTSVCRDRKLGFIEAVNRAGLELREDWIIETGFEPWHAAEVVKKLWEDPIRPDGILGINDRVLAGASHALTGMGVSIPEDVSMIGFSDNPLSSLIRPTLSSVRQPAYEMGEVAATLILEQIDLTGIPAEPVHKVLDTRLILRESTRS
ncbi:MAG: LacI family transcriptional regulator [Bacteroidia bacterium]|nr:LacI family transcriptional regulator [Bacteroidia bacterium]